MILANWASKYYIGLQVTFYDVPPHAPLELNELIADEAEETTRGLNHFSCHQVCDRLCGGENKGYTISMKIAGDFQNSNS